MSLITYIAVSYVAKMGSLNAVDGTIILGFIGVLEIGRAHV